MTDATSSGCRRKTLSGPGSSRFRRGGGCSPDMTVLENLLVGSSSPVARARRQENLATVFELFPKVRERSAQLAGTLSGGEQQMVAIARALMALPAAVATR